jgi:hypothetical protein
MRRAFRLRVSWASCGSLEAASLVHMCRSIHTLHNFEPAANDEEVHAAALQYVRKISGTTRPSKVNTDAFERAVAEIAHITHHLLEDLVATTPPKDREVEAAKAHERAVRRFSAA